MIRTVFILVFCVLITIGIPGYFYNKFLVKGIEEVVAKIAAWVIFAIIEILLHAYLIYSISLNWR